MRWRCGYSRRRSRAPAKILGAKDCSLRLQTFNTYKGSLWHQLQKLFPDQLLARLEVFRPVRAILDTQIAALTLELEAASVKDLPHGLGGLTTVVLTREVCDWHRFKNRRQVCQLDGLCPGEHSSGTKRVQGSVTKHGLGGGGEEWRLAGGRGPQAPRASMVELAWRFVRFQPAYPPVRESLALLSKGLAPPEPSAESQFRCRAASGY